MIDSPVLTLAEAAALLRCSPDTVRRRAMAGVDPQRLRQIGGWSTMAMVERYSHLNVENLRDAMELLPDVAPAGGGVVPIRKKS